MDLFLWLVLISLLILSLFTGRVVKLSMLAALAGAAFLFYVGFSLAAAAVAAVAALAVLARRKSAEEEDDVAVEKECMPLKEGLKILPLDARAAVKKVLKKPADYHELCIHIYRGRGVAGGRDLVMVLDLFTALSETLVRICRRLGELGYPCAVDVDNARVYFKFKPDKTQPAAQHI
jgi:hypothetical protein